MAITLQQKVVFSGPQNGSSKTLSVTCTAGTNAGLFVVVTMADTVNFGSATYTNASDQVVTMHKIGSRRYGNLAIRQCGYWLHNPKTGTAKNFTVNFTGGQFNPISVYAQSFTGVAQSNITLEHSFGFGNVGGVNGTTPHSRNITITANDVICLSGVSTQGMSFPFVIGGANAALEVNQHNVNGKFISVAYSGTSLSAGSTVCTTKSNSGKITNHAWVIPDATGGGGGSTRRIILIA
jgi:hypothetical protein